MESTLEEIITAIMSLADKLIENIYKLMQTIWNDEKMLDDWNVTLIFPIHKKGLNMKGTYHRRLLETINLDFVTTDRQHTKYFDEKDLENCYEYNILTHHPL
ncbi:hypothetical protein CWI36_0141p0030 [Hamiltosporidium magnivora]|uniref:Uncharacterized protein n=1 Tax=Hamiltosporidium magnivora TaxID=148818 RepID=A0A4Q9LK71_9MICR|nr:hypothetical protein CWI36_0141p0030 [Hamiltosporidium magnivora]